MEFQDVVDRWLVPVDFEERPIPPEVLNQVISNAQRLNANVLVLETTADRRRFWRAQDPTGGLGRDGWGTVYDAPIVLIICAHIGSPAIRRWHEERASTGLPDLARQIWERHSAQSSLLAELSAIDGGIGSMPVPFIRVDAVSREFCIPVDHMPAAAVVLGYATKKDVIYNSRAPSQQPGDFIHYGRWGEHTVRNTTI